MEMFNLAPVPVPDLTGRVVLVTGAGRGIGAELVRVLVRQGATVFAGLFGESEALPDAAVTLPLDVTQDAEAEAAAAVVAALAGRLDVLVNNAGLITPIGPLADLPTAALAPAFAVNVMGVHRMVRACLPLLRASRGAIVNAGTGAATTPMEGWTAYCTSKAGVHMLTRMLDLELRAEGVASFFVGIPPTDTAMQAEIRAAGLNPISQIPQDKLVPAAVPASVLAYLCSVQGRAIEDVLLDVRQDRFTAMMDLPG
jgi:NAD(P)-dependent dehydrogenase (short-subunit alcohol dehydrogenase family)